MNLPNFFSISYKFFRKSCFIRRHTIAQKNFGWTYADCRISGEKGFASRLNNSLDWWCKAHFFCAYAKEVLLRVSDDFSFSAVPLSRKRKAVSDRPIHKWNKPSCTAGKPGRMILSVRPDTLGQTYKIILPCRWFTRFHASGYVPFPFWRFPFFTDFSFEVFLSNLPPLPFTSIFASFSEPHQAVISVLGAKVIPGLDGNARSSLLFSAKISSPAGSIFPEKPCIP